MVPKSNAQNVVCCVCQGIGQCCMQSVLLWLLQALKVLRAAEYAPYIVFIAAPRACDLKDLKNINVSCGPSHISWKICSDELLCSCAERWSESKNFDECLFELLCIYFF